MHQQPPPNELMTVQRFGATIAADVDYSTLAGLVASGQVRADDAVLRPGAQVPMKVADVPGLFSSRSFTMALVLSVVLGFFGVDRFYLGYTGLGILKLLVGLGSVGLAVVDAVVNGLAESGEDHSLALTLVSSGLQLAQFVWYAVDIVRIATRKLGDADGRRLK